MSSGCSSGGCSGCSSASSCGVSEEFESLLVEQNQFSDIKKVIQWYNLLLSKGFLEETPTEEKA